MLALCRQKQLTAGARSAFQHFYNASTCVPPALRPIELGPKCSVMAAVLEVLFVCFSFHKHKSYLLLKTKFKAGILLDAGLIFMSLNLNRCPVAF